ncbi:hypothetical protein Tco_0162173 [Tanacetum coccineum]
MSMKCLAYELYWTTLSINMNPVAAKQVALDNSLVPSEKRLKIEKCNARIEFNKPQREETYQVTLDDLKLSPCYPAFLITAEVPEIYPRLLNQDFIKPPSEEELVTFIQELGYSGKCISGKTTGLDRLRESRAQILWGMYNKKNVDYTQDYQQYGALIPGDMINQDIKDSKAYKTYYDFATRKATSKKVRKYKKVASPLRKLTPVLEDEPTEKPKQAKKPAKKFSTVRTTGVAIIDTPSESVPKKKTPSKVDRGKGMDLFSDVALLEAAQLKKTFKKSKLKTHKLHTSGSSNGVGSQPKVPDEQEDKTTGTDEGTSTKPGVPDVPKYLSESENESWGDSSDDKSNDDDSDEVTKDDDEDDVESDADDDKEASDNEKTDSDEDENLNLNQNDDKEDEHEEEYVRTPDSFEFNNDDEEYEELYKDVNVRLIDTEHEEQGKEDEEMTNDGRDDISSRLEDSIKKSFRSYTVEFEKKAKDERKRYIDLVEKAVKEIIKDENIVLAKSSSQPKLTYEAAASLTKFELKKILLDKIQKSKSYQGAQEHKDLYDALVKSYKLDKDLFESYGKVYSLKRDREDKDKDEDPPARSDQGLKKQKMSKDAKPSKGSKSKESKSSSSKGSKSQSKTSGKSAQAEELVFETADIKMPLNQGEDLGNTNDQLNVEATSKDDWFKKPKRPPTPDSYWNTTKKYTTSTTKTKAAKYDTIEGIEDMVSSLWTPMKQLYKFKEGDFLRLNLRDIKDLLLLLVQKKLSNLEKDAIFNLNVALRMFTRRVIILKWVEDIQLGVESYQNKLNITRPETFRSDSTKMTPCTAYNNPQGIIYQDKFKRNRLMPSDELYKLCDGTLTFVRRILHDISSSLDLDYLPKRRWSKLDRKRSRIMIKAIDQQLFERRLMRNLEKFVGGREYREDFRLLERTI